MSAVDVPGRTPAGAVSEHAAKLQGPKTMDVYRERIEAAKAPEALTPRPDPAVVAEIQARMKGLTGETTPLCVPVVADADAPGSLVGIRSHVDPARPWGTWKAPPDRRSLVRLEARIGEGHKVHVTVDFGRSGEPVELKIDVHKVGSSVRGLLDTVAVFASQALQHGATIGEVIDRMIGVQFEPCGDVKGHETITECLSLVDLVGRMLAAECGIVVLGPGGAK